MHKKLFLIGHRLGRLVRRSKAITLQKNMFVPSVKRFFGATATLLLVIALSFLGLLAINGDRSIVCMMSQYELTPPTHKELSLWLGKQPGVVADSVRVFRKDRQLFVVFFIDRSFLGQPELPDIDTQCKSLGYVCGPFRQCTTAVKFPPEAG